ncbi:hypothetical protein TYRP_021686 [Tyrophagus putrescentiae]|nr:hypothetical protein TYRP_021686 [Tyrophagus putrescentiae]
MYLFSLFKEPKERCQCSDIQSLLRSSMKQANVRIGANHILASKFKHQPKHTVSRWMLRAKVEHNVSVKDFTLELLKVLLVWIPGLYVSALFTEAGHGGQCKFIILHNIGQVPQSGRKPGKSSGGTDHLDNKKHRVS